MGGVVPELWVEKGHFFGRQNKLGKEKKYEIAIICV